MKPEYIIIGVIVLFGLYIFIQSSISNKKLSGKSASKKTDGKLELKTVVSEKEDTDALEKKARELDEMAMKKAALESIEYEKQMKQKELEAQATSFQESQFSEEEKKVSAKLAEMRYKMEAIDFNQEERAFIDEVNELSPRLKAILFAELLNKHGIGDDEY